MLGDPSAIPHKGARAIGADRAHVADDAAARGFVGALAEGLSGRREQVPERPGGGGGGRTGEWVEDDFEAWLARREVCVKTHMPKP